MWPIKILLIERHAVFTHSVIDLLKLYSDLEVMAAASDGEWGLMEAEALQLDVIVVGLDLHGSNGLSIIKKLRSSYPTTGIIALSLHDQDSYQKAALSAGADDFVSKLRAVEDLVPAIQRVAQFRAANPGQ